VKWITGSAAQVSNINAALKSSAKKSKRGRRGATNGAVSLSDLMAAKQLAGEIGLEKDQEAIGRARKARELGH